MKAIHAVSTKPAANYYVRRGTAAPYQPADFEILTTVLSALEWRRWSGPITLYTDEAGRAYYERLGLLDLWDGGVDTDCLERAAREINSDVFWSFGKIVALRHEAAPCGVLDTDLIVWSDIRPLIRRPVMSLHSEPLTFPAYVARERLTSPPDFDWSGLDWSVAPCSAALLFFGDEEFKTEYAERALSFMVKNPVRSEVGGPPVHPIFVEQRLLAMCARAQNVDIGTFLRDYRGGELQDGSKNTIFTHLWNAKSRLLHDSIESRELCMKYVRRIHRDYPRVAATLARAERFCELFDA